MEGQGGLLAGYRGEVNSHHYSPTLRWIIVLVYTKPVNSQRQKKNFVWSIQYPNPSPSSSSPSSSSSYTVTYRCHCNCHFNMSAKNKTLNHTRQKAPVHYIVLLSYETLTGNFYALFKLGSKLNWRQSFSPRIKGISEKIYTNDAYMFYCFLSCDCHPILFQISILNVILTDGSLRSRVGSLWCGPICVNFNQAALRY